MAPINSESRKTKIIGVKWLKSVFGVSKRKTADINQEKCVNYEDNVFDAVPGPTREENNTPNFDSIPNYASFNSRRESYEINSDNEHMKPEIEEILDEEKKPTIEEESDEEKPKSRYGGSNQQRFPFYSESSGFGGIPFASQNNVHITGNNVHIGPTSTCVYYVGYGNANQQQASKNPEKSEKVKVILKSKQKVERSHLECLSQQFDKQWRQIGLKLSFTNGEIQHFKSQHNDRKEASFHMLMKWCEDQGNVTIGQLCRALWDTKLEDAVQAVNKLSVKINLL